MRDQQGLEWTFDTVAGGYEKMRPGYSQELYRKLFDYIPLGRESNVLEIGIGAGQATGPILRTGCRLTAVEYGENFSRLCREKFREFPNFTVVTGRFEEADLPPESFDFIFSASAFHWIPEKTGYPKVYSLLKSGGAFARFANHPFEDKGRKDLADEIQELYALYYTGPAGRPAEYSWEMAQKRADIAAAYGFKDIQCALFHRTRTFSSREYTALLGTYSDPIAMEETRRGEFFSRIEQAIDAHGGRITLYDTMDLQLARKP